MTRFSHVESVLHILPELEHQTEYLDIADRAGHALSLPLVTQNPKDNYYSAEVT